MYQERCKEENLHENQHAVLRDLLHAREKEKREKKASQRNLDEMFQKAEKLKEFSRDNVLKVVAEFAVCSLSKLSRVTSHNRSHFFEPSCGHGHAMLGHLHDW